MYLGDSPQTRSKNNESAIFKKKWSDCIELKLCYCLNNISYLVFF